MAKRLTEKQKSEIAENFKNGKTIEALSEDFNCTILTITRNLKKDLGEKIFKELAQKNRISDKFKNADFDGNPRIVISKRRIYRNFSFTFRPRKFS